MVRHKGRLTSCPTYRTTAQVQSMTAQAYIMCYKFKVKGEYEWNTSEDGETSFPVKFDIRPNMIKESENGHYRIRGLSRGAQIEAYAWLDDQPSSSPLNHFGF